MLIIETYDNDSNFRSADLKANLIWVDGDKGYGVGLVP